MKLTILKEELKEGLKATERVATKNITLPILSYVLLSAQKNSCKLITTNLEIASIFNCLAKVEEEGEIAIPVKTLSDLISTLDAQTINLEVKGKVLKIFGENFKAEIKGTDPKDFPIIPQIERTSKIELNPLPLIEGILQVIDFCSPSQTRPELSGVFFSFLKDQLELVATDSFRLARKTLLFEKPQEIEGNKSFILPRNAAREIVNLFSDQEGKINLYLASGQIMLESYLQGTQNPRKQLIARLIEGEFPDYHAVIPKSYQTQVVLDKRQFVNSIKAASIFAGSGNEIFLNIDPQKKKVEISAQNADLGQTNIEFLANIKGEKIKICFNWKFLIEGVNKITTDQLIFELNQESGPGLIKPTEFQDFLYILMPIKQT